MLIVLLVHRKEGYEVVYKEKTWINESHNKPGEWNENKKGKSCCSLCFISVICEGMMIGCMDTCSLIAIIKQYKQ